MLPPPNQHKRNEKPPQMTSKKNTFYFFYVTTATMFPVRRIVSLETLANTGSSGVLIMSSPLLYAIMVVIIRSSCLLDPIFPVMVHRSLLCASFAGLWSQWKRSIWSRNAARILVCVMPRLLVTMFNSKTSRRRNKHETIIFCIASVLAAVLRTPGRSFCQYVWTSRNGFTMACRWCPPMPVLFSGTKIFTASRHMGLVLSARI